MTAKASSQRCSEKTLASRRSRRALPQPPHHATRAGEAVCALLRQAKAGRGVLERDDVEDCRLLWDLSAKLFFCLARRAAPTTSFLVALCQRKM